MFSMRSQDTYTGLSVVTCHQNPNVPVLLTHFFPLLSLLAAVEKLSLLQILILITDLKLF